MKQAGLIIAAALLWSLGRVEPAAAADPGPQETVYNAHESPSSRRRPRPTHREMASVSRPLKPSGLMDSETQAVPGSGLGKLQVLVRRAVVGTVLAGALAGALFFTVGKRRLSLPSHPSSCLELVSTLSIGPRCSLSLVQAQGQTVLIARDASGVKQMLLVPPQFDVDVIDTDQAEQPIVSSETTLEPRG